MGLSPLDAFAAEVGGPAAGPVVAVGGRTRWAVGGAVDAAARQVRAPSGIVAHEPSEMTVRVRAGTPVAELAAALAAAGQRVALPDHPGATVGGVVAVGWSDVHRLGRGPLRDAVLEVRFVSAGGDVVTGGGPTVKNVSGYDLPRLLVGSLGTLGLVAEVVLRTSPVPAESRWFSTAAEPFALLAALYRPSALLWDGTTAWALLEGHPLDVEEQVAAHGLVPASGPPARPEHRWSLAPGALRALPGDGHGPFVAELGVGVVHRTVAQPPRPVEPVVADLNARVKRAFDPTGRLAPGRQPW